MSGYFRNDNPNNGWVTPPEVMDPVKAFFGGHVGIDPCAGAQAHAIVNLRYPDQNGLTTDWKAAITASETRWIFANSYYMNCPYLPVYCFKFVDATGLAETVEGVAQDCFKHFVTRLGWPRDDRESLGVAAKLYRDRFYPGGRIDTTRTDVRDWIRKALDSDLEGVMLLPVKTESRPWQDPKYGLFERANAVCYIRGRVSFIDPATGKRRDPAQHASALIYRGDRVRDFGSAFEALGHCEQLGTL